MVFCSLSLGVSISWQSVLILTYIFVISSFHLVHYLGVKLVHSLSVSFVFALAVTLVAANKKTTRQVVFLTVPSCFCRVFRIYLISFVTGDALFKPIIAVAISLLQTSKCTAEEGAKSTQKVLTDYMTALAAKSQQFSQKISSALQSLVLTSVEDKLKYITDWISGIGLGEVSNPLSDLKKQLDFNVSVNTTSSVSVHDNVADQISLAVRNYIKDVNNTLCLVKALMGLSSFLNVFVVLPYTKYKRLQVFTLKELAEELSADTKFRQTWAFVRGCFNPIIGICFVLPFVILCETILVSSYTKSGELYAKTPPALNHISLIHFNNTGNPIGNIIADGLNDIVGSDISSSAALDINKCYMEDLGERSWWNFVVYIFVLILASLTYPLEQYFEDNEELILSLSEF